MVTMSALIMRVIASPATAVVLPSFPWQAAKAIITMAKRKFKLILFIFFISLIFHFLHSNFKSSKGFSVSVTKEYFFLHIKRISFGQLQKNN
jgi:hypothetical protein